MIDGIFLIISMVEKWRT